MQRRPAPSPTSAPRSSRPTRPIPNPRSGLRWRPGVFSVQNHHLSGYEGGAAGKAGRRGGQAGGRRPARLQRRWPRRQGQRRWVLGDQDGGGGVPQDPRSPRYDPPPTAFMELMTEPKFFPPASVWHLMPKLMDRSTGGMADGRGPGRHRRQGLRRSGPLHRTRSHAASDVQSIAACRAIWREVTGRPPRRFPMPRWLFERFAGTDETTMWRWLGANKVDFDTGPTLTIHPAALTVREWLQRKQARSVRRRQGRTSA